MLCTVNDIAPKVAGFLVMVDHSTICVRILFFMGRVVDFIFQHQLDGITLLKYLPFPTPGGPTHSKPCSYITGQYRNSA